MKPALLASLPRLRWRGDRCDPLVRPEVEDAMPALRPDLEILEREVLPDFYGLDEAALRAENTFRLGQLFVIVGGAAATSLGAVQAALGGGVIAIGIAEALVAGAFAGAVSYVRGRDAQRDYFTNRLRAERLRGEYFLFLGRVGRYDADDDDDRLARLRQEVDGVVTSEDAA
jgi:Protein of unknown function (DUF4231)